MKTMKNKLAAALALTLAGATLMAGTALAQETRATRTNRNEVTEFTFGDHAVGGGTRGPDGDSIHSRLRTRRDTLIQPRVHYVNEMLKSVETL
jgi:hypothetical protein